MKEKILARRYAETYIDYAKRAQDIKTIVLEFKNFKKLLQSSKELGDFFVNPQITFLEKARLIDDVISRSFSEEFRMFLKLILEKNHFILFNEITDFLRVNYAHGGAIDGLLKTSYPLDLELIKKIKQKIELRFKRKLNLYLELDGSLLGGVQVTVGNTIIDGSVRRRLDDLKEKLKSIKVL